jgi:hypothetical protein
VPNFNSFSSWQQCAVSQAVGQQANLRCRKPVRLHNACLPLRCCDYIHPFESPASCRAFSKTRFNCTRRFHVDLLHCPFHENLRSNNGYGHFLRLSTKLIASGTCTSSVHLVIDIFKQRLLRPLRKVRITALHTVAVRTCWYQGSGIARGLKCSLHHRSHPGEK